jgi:hypothetical protein
VIKLVLRPDGYEWEFVPQAGRMFTDVGEARCEPDTVPPSAPTDLKAAATGYDRVELSWSAAVDEGAVTGYEILRDGAQIASIDSSTTYVDTAVEPATTYGYAVVARDAAGNRSDPSTTAVATTPRRPTILTVTPEADARVEQANPTLNFGQRSLRTDGGVGEAVESYLRFDVSGLSGPVESARLRLFADTPSLHGPEVYTASADWTESAVTWETRPARGDEALDAAVAVGDDGWVEYDVTAAVTGDGTYTFALAQPGRDGVDFRSRESTLRPELVLVSDILTATAYAAEADARVEFANPDANFGRLWLRTDGGRDAPVESYLRFAVAGISGELVSATLRVFATTPSVDGPEVYRAGDEWRESEVTWANRPARGEEALDQAVAVPNDGWLEYDVSAAVKGAGTYTFALSQTGNDGADFRPRESVAGPELVVVTRG